MLDGISAQTFREWIAYDALEPFGEERADLRMAIETACIANLLKGKAGRAFKPKDFMPDFSPRPKQTAEAMNAKLAQFASMMEAYRGSD